MRASSGVEPTVDLRGEAEPSIGGASLRVLSPEACLRARETAHQAVREWSHERCSSRLRAFPFAEVLVHLRSVGRLGIDPDLRESLVTARALAWPGEVLLSHWFPMALDQDDGDYDSYVGNPVLIAAAASDDALTSEQMVDATLIAASADLVKLESEALTALPSQAQSTRVRSCVRVLAFAQELAPAFALPLCAHDELSELLEQWADMDDVGRAHASYRCALRVSGQVPSVVRDAVDITLLPTTKVHDEQMFIRCIQIFETLYRQVADRIAQSIMALESGETDRASTLLTEATRRVSATRVLYRVLTTMPPKAFSVIRAHTHGRSAVQSRAYRRVEDLSAARPADGPAPQEADAKPPGTTLQEVLLHKERALGVRATAPVREAMRELDSVWRAMKRSHWGVTLKIIGRVPGTGGTSGADYLRDTAERPLFPCLSTSTQQGV